MKIITAIVALLTSFSVTADGWWFSSDKIKDDEQVIFFPSEAYQKPGSQEWTTGFHGWIFEPESFGEINSIVRKALDIPDDDHNEKNSLLKQRLQWFIVDNERGKKLSVKIDKQHFKLNKSTANGHFRGETTLNYSTLKPATKSDNNTLIKFTAITSKGDQRDFSGEIHPIPSKGLSVISDIDDTIKISQVTNKKELIKNTFMRPFKIAPGMSELYRQWHINNNAIFHYVSASPWQLYPPLSSFMNENRFPKGLFHMKSFRLKDSSFMNLFSDPVEYKMGIIESILKRYPQRNFILVGDSGEKDPEVYGMIARKYPGQIKYILIRKVGENNNDERFNLAFAELATDRWQTFTKTPEIETAQVLKN